MQDRTVCSSCYNRHRRKNNKNTLIQNQQPKIVLDKNNKNNVNNPSLSTFESHAYVVKGPRNVGKISYTLKMLEKIGNQRPIQMITRSPKQHPSYKTSKLFKLINKYKRSGVKFDDMLEARNSSGIDEFFTKG